MMHLKFQGYYPSTNITAIPNRPGIYCIYEGFKSILGGMGSPNKLLYIGESSNIYDRIQQHLNGSSHISLESYKDNILISYAHTGASVLFNSLNPQTMRRDCEKQLIWENKPSLNTRPLFNPGFAVSHSGKNALLV